MTFTRFGLSIDTALWDLQNMLMFFDGRSKCILDLFDSYQERFDSE